MAANEWMSWGCLDEGATTQNIRNSSIRSHPSEEENRFSLRNVSLRNVVKCGYSPAKFAIFSHFALQTGN
jgi:hypothetical protein